MSGENPEKGANWLQTSGSVCAGKVVTLSMVARCLVAVLVPDEYVDVQVGARQVLHLETAPATDEP